ncbi:nuclear pore complex protein nup1 [Phtheirospermum japonicum]|uniref:Nuclear pore complex protein nup1 n=1 Tax=Phtheirospermum japonicum TaxID=374723 RepID=A0A830DH16_9LAMI|nr:nuclear pore complex protein nup1 [Phtheirospermum japonicum]
MATAKEGGATPNTTSSSYGGGGAGGKFPRKPSRRSTKPYDRPPTALRVNNDSNSSWLRKLVVEPASKLISYGADRFFAPLLRKRLPPSSPPQPPEAEADISDGVQGAVRDIQDGVQEPPCDCSQPMNSSSSNGISELEQLLKQRTFTRSEIVHLRELLQTKAVEVSLEDVGQKNEDTASDYARHQQFASRLLEENRNGGNRSSVSTPIVNSKVLEDDNASPAELAKAYMGSRPSKVSPSVLGMRSRVGKEDTGLLSSFPSASASPIMALTKKTPSSLAAPDNGFITPRSRGRSAIYNMARTPYSKFHLTSNLKGSGINSNGYAGPSMSSSFLFPVESHEKLDSLPMSLKRRSTVLDEELGFDGSLRRTRQKSNLLASGIHHTTHGVVIGSHAKQKLPLVGEASHKLTKDVGENENESVPSSSYARVPSKSSEVATKILQHLEKLTPKEKSAESKLVAKREKSPLTLTPNMLSGRALRSMDDVNSSKLLLDVQDDHKLGDMSNATLADARDFSMQKQEKVEENGPKEIVAPSYKWNSVANNDSVVSLKSSSCGTIATDSNVKTGASQPPQKKRAFRMSAQEDYFEQDDDAHCNGLAPRPFSENKGPMEASLTDSKVAPPEEPKLERPSIQSPDMSPLALISSKTSELYSVAATLGEVSNVFSPASEETTAASQSAVLPLSVAAFDKPKEANNPPLFNFSCKVVEKVASLPSEPRKEAELKIESSSSSLVNVSASTGSQVKIPESNKNPHLNLFKAGDVNGKFDFVPSAASNGPPLISSPLAVSFPAASNDVNQISKGSSALPFTSSTSTLAASSGSIFGQTANPSSSAGPVIKFGAAVDQATSVSAASTTSVSVVADLGTNAEMGTSSGSSLSNVSACPTNTFGLSGSSVSFSAPNNLQSCLFGSGAGTGLQCTSAQSSLPASNINSSTSLGSSSSSQIVNPSSAVSGPTSSAVKFGASLTGGSAVSSSSGATTPGTSFSFGFGSSSCSASAIGPSTAPLFGFSANSSGSGPVTNTVASSLSSGGVFNFAGNNSSASSSSAPLSTSVFGSGWQSTTFGSSTFTSPSTGFAFSSPAPSGPAFSFTTASSSVSVSQQQPVFGNNPASPVTIGFGAAASPDQMNAEDSSMAEDTVLQTSAAAVPIFGQPSSSTPPAASFAFGSSPVGSQPNPFMFGGQQNQVAPQNLSPFQASGSLDFNAGGGSFSLGSGGGDKSGRKMVRISKSKNRKK